MITALHYAHYDGHLTSDYEGQRFFQDRDIEDLADEVEQVCRHQEMLPRLSGRSQRSTPAVEPPERAVEARDRG